MADVKECEICHLKLASQSDSGASTTALSVSQFWTAHCVHTSVHEYCIQQYCTISDSCLQCDKPYTILGLRKVIPDLRNSIHNQDKGAVMNLLRQHFPDIVRGEIADIDPTSIPDTIDAGVLKLILAECMFRLSGTLSSFRLEALRLIRSAMQSPHLLTKLEQADALRFESVLCSLYDNKELTDRASVLELEIMYHINGTLPTTFVDNPAIPYMPDQKEWKEWAAGIKPPYRPRRLVPKARNGNSVTWHYA